MFDLFTILPKKKYYEKKFEKKILVMMVGKHGMFEIQNIRYNGGDGLLVETFIFDF